MVEPGLPSVLSFIKFSASVRPTKRNPRMACVLPDRNIRPLYRFWASKTAKHWCSCPPHCGPSSEPTNGDRVASPVGVAYVIVLGAASLLSPTLVPWKYLGPWAALAFQAPPFPSPSVFLPTRGTFSVQWKACQAPPAPRTGSPSRRRHQCLSRPRRPWAVPCSGSRRRTRVRVCRGSCRGCAVAPCPTAESRMSRTWRRTTPYWVTTSFATSCACHRDSITSHMS